MFGYIEYLGIDHHRKGFTHDPNGCQAHIFTLKAHEDSPGFTNVKNQVFKLKKALYRLKQYHTWTEAFDSFVKTLSVPRTNVDMRLNIGNSNDSKIYLLLYVDDIIITANNVIKANKIKNQHNHYVKDFYNILKVH